MIWTRNYVSETQGYESQNIFLLHNPWIEDQFSNMRGAWIIFCFTLHNLYSWKTTNSFPRASRSPEFNLPVSCCVYLHPHNLRHTLQKEPLTFVFWADVPQSNIEPIITKNPSFSGWKLSFEGKKWRKFVPSYINVRYTVKKITWIWTSVLLVITDTGNRDQVFLATSLGLFSNFPGSLPITSCVETYETCQVEVWWLLLLAEIFRRQNVEVWFCLGNFIVWS